MDLMRTYLQVRELALRKARGQTMAEYSLILAAIAVVAFAGYQTMGSTVSSLLGTVDGKL